MPSFFMRLGQYITCTPYILRTVIPNDSLTDGPRVKFADRLIIRPDQNTNNLWEGITYAIEQGFREITVLGAFGKREDHTLGTKACSAKFGG